MRTVVRSAVLIAFSVACGYAKFLLFPYLFFVEIFIVSVFLSGSLAGVAWGAWVGAVAGTVFSLVNIYGVPHPLVIASQAACPSTISVHQRRASPTLAASASCSAANASAKAPSLSARSQSAAYSSIVRTVPSRAASDGISQVPACVRPHARSSNRTPRCTDGTPRA